MSVKELKTRGRSLLARVLVFSMMLCTLFYREIQPKTAAAATETGESLTVYYLDNSGKTMTEQTYQRYYADEAANIKDETVTITTPSDGELEDGSQLIAWNINNTKVVRGGSVDLNWSELVATASSTALTVSPDVLSYSIENSYNYYLVNVPGTVSVTCSDDGSYTVTMPGTPTVTGGSFVRWKATGGNGVYYADAGGALVTEDGLPVNFSGSMSLSIAAEWVPMATIKYYDSMEEYYSDSPMTTFTQVAEYEEGKLMPLSFSVAEGLGSSEGKYFLAWYIESSYVTPGTNLTYEWSSLPSGYPVKMVATWLTPEFSSNVDGVLSNETFANTTISVSNTADGYTVTAPSAPTHKAYFFDKWRVYFSDMPYEAAAGGTLDEVFPYSGDQSILLEAQWVEKKSAQVTYDLNDGTYVADGTTYDGTYSTVLYQENETDTEQAVTLIGAPKRDGYSFTGWKYSGEAGETIYAAGATTDIAFPFREDGMGPTFVAQWTPVVTVRYIDDAGVSLLPDVTITRQSETEETFSITVAAGVDNAEGGAFLAWTGAVGEQEYYRPGDTITFSWAEASDYSEIMFLPCWLKGNTYEEGTSVSLSIIHGETLEDGFQVSISGTAPTKEGYFFTGWENPYGGVNASGIITDGDGNPITFDYLEYANAGIDFTAKYEEAKTAQIIFSLSGGTYNNSTENIVTTITQQSAEETSYYVTMPGKPTKEGYIFDNWADWSAHIYQPGESTEKFGISYSFTEEAPSFLAVWLTPKTATLTFDLAGGTYNGSTENVILTITQASKSDAYGITTIGAPEKEGYVFEGWEVVVNGKTYTIGAGMTTEPFGCTYPAHPTLTLTALWTEEAEVTPTPTVTVTPTPTVTVTPTLTVTPIPEPTEIPESDPAVTPTVTPNVTPTAVPTLAPSVTPVVTPTQVPSATPTVEPTQAPSPAPSATPTVEPTQAPSPAPSATPTVVPTSVPSITPSLRPTIMPTVAPTQVPSVIPTWIPTATPSPVPTAEPTKAPSPVPSATPTVTPSPVPTVEPTQAPSPVPSATPTVTPSPVPTVEPTKTPSPVPSATPTVAPSPVPTAEPTKTPSPVPSATPTVTPSPVPTVEPTKTPSPVPSAMPTVTPTVTPSPEPTVSPTPTPAPENKEVITVFSGEMELVAGQKYVFPEGKWRINGDSTVYEGGMEFYIGATGNYVISEGE